MPTEVELQLIKLLSEGYSSYEISVKMFKSYSWVQKKRLELVDVYECRNACHLVSIAYKNKWIL